MSNSNWKKNFFYPKGQYGLGGAYSTIQYDFETKDHIELKDKYLTMEKLKEIINNVMEFFTCTEEDIKEWFNKEEDEDEEDEEEDEDEEEYMMMEKKFWETVGLGKEERKEFEKNIASNFINCIVFSARKNKIDVNTFIDEAKKEYDFDLII
jgi:CO dehydrogenase/acetyl-CoA synthase beta subunit